MQLVELQLAQPSGTNNVSKTQVPPDAQHHKIAIQTTEYVFNKY